MGAKIPGTLFLNNLFERRSLLFQLVRRDFEQRFVGSAVGWVWGLIQPLVLLLSYSFVFSICMKVPVPAGAGTHNYSLYLFAGILPWFLFSETVQRSAGSLLEQANLITKTVFPAEMVPLSIFFSSLIGHVMSLALLVAAVGVFENHVSIYIVFLPIYIILTGLFAVGIGWIVASLHVFLRDTGQVVVVMLTLWFWVTPIFIAVEQVPKPLRILILANPLAYVVRGYRDILLSSRPPNPGDLLLLALSSCTAFVVGGLFFRQMKRGFADVL